MNEVGLEEGVVGHVAKDLDDTDGEMDIRIRRQMIQTRKKIHRQNSFRHS